MKTNLSSSSLHAALIAAAMLILPQFAAASDQSATGGLERTLAHNGSIALHAVGPYVETGTYRVQVAVKLGTPTSVLPDGTWLYRGFRIEDTEASGTLVVRFQQGRVSGLSLATPQAIAALRTSPGKPDRTFVAATEPRR